MNLKRILAIGLSTLMLASLSACGDSSDDDKDKDKETTAEVTTEATTEAEESDSDISSVAGGDSQDLILQSLETGFKSSFGDDLDIYYEEDGNNYVINLWKDGLADALKEDGAADTWNSLIQSLPAAVTQMQDAIRQLDPEANITLNFVSDVDNEEVLLTIYNGEITYNAIQ